MASGASDGGERKEPFPSIFTWSVPPQKLERGKVAATHDETVNLGLEKLKLTTSVRFVHVVGAPKGAEAPLEVKLDVRRVSLLPDVRGSLRELLADGDFCDVELRAADGATARAHGVVLAAASPVFRTALAERWAAQQLRGPDGDGGGGAFVLVLDVAECADATAAADLVALAYDVLPPTAVRTAVLLPAAAMWLPAAVPALEARILEGFQSEELQGAMLDAAACGGVAATASVYLYAQAARLGMRDLQVEAFDWVQTSWANAPVGGERRAALLAELMQQPALLAGLLDGECPEAEEAQPPEQEEQRPQ